MENIDIKMEAVVAWGGIWRTEGLNCLGTYPESVPGRPI